MSRPATRQPSLPLSERALEAIVPDVIETEDGITVIEDGIACVMEKTDKKKQSRGVERFLRR